MNFCQIISLLLYSGHVDLLRLQTRNQKTKIEDFISKFVVFKTCMKDNYYVYSLFGLRFVLAVNPYLKV